jgi:hypothetical protein
MNGASAYYNGGNVGINNSSPAFGLDVQRYTGNTVAKFGPDPGAVYIIENDPLIAFNAYYNGGWIYGGTGYATAIDGAGGTLGFYTAPSGTGGTAATMTARMVIQQAGNVGIGTTSPTSTLHVAGTGNVTGALSAGSVSTASAGVSGALSAGSFSSAGSGIRSYGTKSPSQNMNSANTTGGGFLVSDDGGFFDWNDGYVTYENNCCTGGLRVNANLTVMGTKNFVQAHPTDPTKEIHFAALEGPEAGTYARGTGRLQHGRAEIDLPEGFRLVTSEKGNLTVQVTPSIECTAPVALVSKTVRRVLVAQREAHDDCTFDWLVQGVRAGHEDFQVIRDAPMRAQALAAEAKERAAAH